VTLSFADKLY